MVGLIRLLLTYLLVLTILFCKSEAIQCHVCRSDTDPECSDAFRGHDNRFLEDCNMKEENQTVFCRKEVNIIFPSRPTLYDRYCFYTDGYAPEEEIELMGVTYWTCDKTACNSQSSVRTTFILTAVTVISQAMYFRLLL